MKSNRWIWLVAGAALSCIAAALTVHSSIEAQEKKPPADRDNPFAGKILVVVQKSEFAANYVALENPVLTELKGHQFLVGKRMAKRESPWHGIKASITFDTVGSIYEFDDLESYREFEERVAEEAEEAGQVFQDMVLPNPATPRVVPVPDSE